MGERRCRWPKQSQHELLRAVGVFARWSAHPSGKQRRPDELSTNRVAVPLIRGEPSTRSAAVCQVTA
jgi:hypothetical protein